MLTIEQPKIVRGMTAAEYHKIDAASASRLKEIRRSPAHCRHAIDHPKETDAMRLGTLLHSMVLEPGNLLDSYVVADECDRRTKAGKAAWADFQGRNAGKIILTEEEMMQADAMRQACIEHPAYAKLFTAPGDNELSIFWRDIEHDIDCKARIDRVVDVPGFGKVCVDLKTTTDASPEAFGRAVYNFGYFMQGAFYLDALRRAGISCDVFVVMAVESAAPHGVAVYALSDDTVKQGRMDNRRLLAKYAECAKSGSWGGYSQKIETLSMPVWAFDDEI